MFVNKFFVGAVGATVLATCSWSWSILLDKEPGAKTLDQAKNRDGYDVNTIEGIEHNKSRLVANSAENEDWWNWMFRHGFSAMGVRNELHSHFRGVKFGWKDGSEQPYEGLNQVCERAYKKKLKEFVMVRRPASLRANVEALCTVGGNREIHVDSQE